MEFAIHKIERRMIKQEQLVVQIATEAAHMKIELNDLRTVAASRQPTAFSEVEEETKADSAQIKATSLQLDRPKKAGPDSMAAKSLPLDLPRNIAKVPSNDKKAQTPQHSLEESKKDSKDDGLSIAHLSSEGSQHKPALNRPTGKSAGTLVSEQARSTRKGLFRTGSRVSGGSEETKGLAPDMTDGALNLRRKMTTKVFNAVMVPEQNATVVFVKNNTFRGKFRRVTEQPVFEISFGFFVILSAFLIGVETQSEATNSDHNGTVFLLAQSICALVFVIEIIVRLISYGTSFFGIGTGRVAKEWKWNMFDLLCLFTTIADIFCELFVFDGHHEVLTTLRQFRIVRAARVIRTMRFAREFRKMSYALQYSGSTLLWALITLWCVIFFFATALTQATTEHLQSLGGELDTTAILLRDFYGTMPKSFHSLFQAVSGGKDWDVLIQPLMNLGWILPALFLSYVALTIFGVMNVLTSVFVESAVASYQHYKDILIQENLASMQVYIEHLKEIFVQIDYDNSGEISMDELEVFLNDPSLQQYLESIDVHPDDARTLFRLLDKDNSGYINIDEFCNGCLRLKGEAKSFDIHCIIYEHERLMHKFQEFMTYLERGFLARIDKNVDKKIGTWPLPSPLGVAMPDVPTSAGSPPSKNSKRDPVSFQLQDAEPMLGHEISSQREKSGGVTSHDAVDRSFRQGLPEIGKDIPALDDALDSHSGII